MARRKNGTQPGRGLFDEQERQLERRLRRQRALFIPHLLRDAAASLQLKGEQRDRAHAIAIRWGACKASGTLCGT